jgi:hypothetical protein
MEKGGWELTVQANVPDQGPRKQSDHDEGNNHLLPACK